MLAQELLKFTRQQKKQLAWLWKTYNDKMQSLMPRRQQLMESVNAADALTAGLPIHRPGQPATPPMLDPAEALVDHLKLMQVLPCGDLSVTSLTAFDTSIQEAT